MDFVDEVKHTFHVKHVVSKNRAVNRIITTNTA